MVDAIFNELIFLWIVKIIFRSCLSAVDVFTVSWTIATLSTHFLVVLDMLFDLSQLCILCIYGAKICDGKDKILESLIYMSSKFYFHNQDSRSEYQFFLHLVGHSHFYFTIGNIFCLNKSIAVNILATLVSYVVIIHQFTT